MGKYCEWIKYDYRTICPRKHDAKNPYYKSLSKEKFMKRNALNRNRRGRK